MNIYKLINSNHIYKIITHVTTSHGNPLKTNSYLKIYYLDKESGQGALKLITKDDLILKSIDDLVKNQFIDNKLALALYENYTHLRKENTLIFPESSLETPYKCGHYHSNPNMSMREPVVITNQSTPKYATKFTYPIEPRPQSRPSFFKSTLQETRELEEAIIESIMDQIIFESMDEYETKEAISDSIQLAPRLIEVAQHLHNEVTNYNFLRDGTDNSLEEKQLSSAYKYSHFGVETKLKDVYNIAGLICEFQYDQQGILLLVYSDEIDKETLRISAENKKDILNCFELPQLRNALKDIPHGEYLAEMIGLVIDSKERSGFDI